MAEQRPNDVQRRIMAFLNAPGAFLEVNFRASWGTIGGVPGSPPIVKQATINALKEKRWIRLHGDPANNRAFYVLSSEGREALRRARTNRGQREPK